MPEFGQRLKGETTERIPAHLLETGDRVLVAAGERVPADGVVESGRSSADESLVTGESLPVAKAPGSALTGGSCNMEQPLVMRVTRAGTDTLAAGIARLVERAAAGKPALVDRADRIAHALTYAVIAAAQATQNPARIRFERAIQRRATSA